MIFTHINYLMKNGRNGAITLTNIDGIVSASKSTPDDIRAQSRDAVNVTEPPTVFICVIVSNIF